MATYTNRYTAVQLNYAKSAKKMFERIDFCCLDIKNSCLFVVQ